MPFIENSLRPASYWPVRFRLGHRCVRRWFRLRPSRLRFCLGNSEILRLTQFGHSMDTAFERWSENLGSAPAMDMAFCIRLSVQSGGGLSEALKRFAEALRQELVLAEKMRALTSQGRLQALVMLAIPVLLGAR